MIALAQEDEWLASSYQVVDGRWFNSCSVPDESAAV